MITHAGTASVSFIGPSDDLLARVHEKLKMLRAELGENKCTLPLALFLVIPEEHGGDAVARELIMRHELLDQESRHIIDFCYLGWSLKEGVATFNLRAFGAWRDVLRQIGITRFGGNADLILVDAEIGPDGPLLRLDRALVIDVSKLVAKGCVASLGDFLNVLVAITEEVQKDSTNQKHGIVVRVSDLLGLAYAKESFLEFILEKWGKFIGADRLAAFATKPIAPPVRFFDLELGRLARGEVRPFNLGPEADS